MSKKIFGIKVKEFLNLSQEKQSEWIDTNIPDYEMKLYEDGYFCLLYTSPSPRDPKTSRMPSSA